MSWSTVALLGLRVFLSRSFCRFFHYGHAGSDLYRWYRTTLLKYSLKPVLRIVIDNYETRWITRRTSRPSACHFWITVGRLRVRTTVRWPAIPIYIFLCFFWEPPCKFWYSIQLTFKIIIYLLFIMRSCTIAANNGGI